MTRPLDLDKVKQAWNLRRQGKQQKEIAEALNLSLRHIQNYLSIDWLAQRGMRALMKGGAQEVNDQLKALGRLGEMDAIGAGKLRPQSKDESEHAANGEANDPSSCQAPEQWPDVARLEGWGVPRYGAPGVLGAWRRAHRDEAHELCALWGELVQNVQASIPFPDAYDLTIAGWLADRWGMSSLKVSPNCIACTGPGRARCTARCTLMKCALLWATEPGRMGPATAVLPSRSYPGDSSMGCLDGLWPKGGPLNPPTTTTMTSFRGLG